MDCIGGLLALWLPVDLANGDQLEMRGREENEIKAFILFIPLVLSLLSYCRSAMSLYLGPQLPSHSSVPL